MIIQKKPITTSNAMILFVLAVQKDQVAREMPKKIMLDICYTLIYYSRHAIDNH